MQSKRTRTRSASPRIAPLALVLLGGLALCFAANLWAAGPLPTTGKPAKFPVWWFEQEAIKPTEPAPTPLPTGWPRYPQDYPAADDFTALQQGQLKQLATAAFDELQAHLYGGAGLAATNLIKSWFETDTVTHEFIYDSGTGRRIPKVTLGQTNDYAPVNLGQLKTVAEPFYDRLIAIGYRSSYPWTNPVNPANDFALANLGQAKNLFAFDPAFDYDHDGLPDWWEDRYGLDKNDPLDAALDADGDGFTNLYEYLHHTDPRDHYNGAMPVITIVSGNGQTTEPGKLLGPPPQQPLVAQVWKRQQGGTLVPLADAPVTFAVALGGGKIIVPATGGPPLEVDSVVLLTGADGQVQVKYLQPDRARVRSRITVTARVGQRSARAEFYAVTTAKPPGGPGDPGPGDGDPNDDPDGDWDHDGLTNAEEQEIGSDPQSDQSDDDGVADGADAMPADSDISFPRAGAPHYALIDIGEGSISAINGKGEAVGIVPAAVDSTDDPVAFFWSKGERKPLQGRKPSPRSINDSGAIVGSAEFAVPGVAGTYNVRAAHWADADSEPTDLGSLGKITTTGSSEEDKQKKPGEWGSSVAVAINNNGMIVGESTHTVPAKPSPNSLTGSSAASGGTGRTTVNLQRPAPGPMPAPGVPSRKAATVPRAAPSSTPSGSSHKAVRFNVGGKPTLLGPGKKDDIKISNYAIALSEGGVAVGMTHNEDPDEYSGAALWDNGVFSKDLGEDFTPTGVTQAPPEDTKYKYYVVGTKAASSTPATLSASNSKFAATPQLAENSPETILMLRPVNGDAFVSKPILMENTVVPSPGTAIGIAEKGLAFTTNPVDWRNGSTESLSASIVSVPGWTVTGFGAMTRKGLLGGGIVSADLAHGAIFIPVEVAELSPKTKDEDGNDIAGSEKPSRGARLTQFVEVDPNTNKIAHREIKVMIDEALKDKKVTWSLEPLPGATPATIRGDWDKSPNHKNRFEASSDYGANGFTTVSQQQGKTTIGADGYTAIRVNVPPIGFNQVRIKIEIEGISTPMNLIDMEVPAVVVIDPGHGGDDSGAVGRTDATIFEKDLTLAYSLSLRQKVIDKFATEKHGLKVVMTRKTTDERPANSSRAQLARDIGADVFLSIHFNSAEAITARGTEYVTRSTGQVNAPEDDQLGVSIQTSTLAAVKASDPAGTHRAPKAGEFAVLSDSSYGNTANYHPIRGTIIEVEFLSHATAIETVKLSNATGTAIKAKFSADVSRDIFDNISNQP